MLKHKAMRAVAAVAMGLGLGVSAQADVTFHPLMGVGLTGGGDKLVDLRYTDGTSTDITAGGLLQIYGGVEARFEAVTAQINVGYHFAKNNASNGSVTFERFPVELLTHYRLNDNWRLGGGVRHIGDAKVHGSGVASGESKGYGSSTGPVVEVEYLFSQHSGLKARVAKDSYQPANGAKVDGTHFGIFWTYYFN